MSPDNFMTMTVAGHHLLLSHLLAAQMCQDIWNMRAGQFPGCDQTQPLTGVTPRSAGISEFLTALYGCYHIHQGSRSSETVAYGPAACSVFSDIVAMLKQLLLETVTRHLRPSYYRPVKRPNTPSDLWPVIVSVS